MPVRTIEFPVTLEPWQVDRIEFYLKKLKTIWNIGLARLNEWDTYTGYYDKNEKAYNPCCPINWEYRRYWLGWDEKLEKRGKPGYTIIDKPSQSQKAIAVRCNDVPEVKGEKGEKGKIYLIEVSFSRILAEASKHLVKEFPQIQPKVPATSSKGKGKTTKQWLQWGEANNKPVVVTDSRLLNFTGVVAIDGCSGYSCPIPQIYKEPLLKNYGFTSSGGIGQAIKGENLAYRKEAVGDYEELIGVPYKYRAGTIKGLSTSWQEYDKSRRKKATNGVVRGKPRYKSSRDKVTTVVHPNPKGVIIPLSNDMLRGVPELGTLKVPGLNKRWRNSDGSYPEIATFKICKGVSRWYVQLTGELDRSPGLRQTGQGGKAIAADPGIINYVTFSDNKIIENPRFWRNLEDKLAKFQTDLAHKRSHNLILWLNHPDTTVGDIKAVIRITSENAQALLHAKTEQQGKEIITQSQWSKLIFKRGEESKAIARLEIKISKIHARIKRMRRTHAHRLSTWLVRNYDVFVCEHGLQKEQLRHRAGIKLDENNIAVKNNKKQKSGLTKSLGDAAHGQFMELCEQKFKEAGRIFLRYPAKNTTLECPICGTDNKPEESNHRGQKYTCSHCHWESYRDQKPGILMLMRLLRTIDTKLLAHPGRYKGELAKFLTANKNAVTLEMVGDEVISAIAYQKDWIARTGGCKSKVKKKRKQKACAA